MSQLENTEDMMSQLSWQFSSTSQDHTTHDSTSQYPSHPTHVRRKTRSEDFNILAHAQSQLQTHLSATSSQNSDSTWRPPQPHPLAHSQPACQRDSDPFQPQQPQIYHHAPRPRSSHHFSTTTYPDLRTPVTNLPFRWWENGVLVSNSSSEEEDVRPSIEHDPAGAVVDSVEMPDVTNPGAVSPRTDIKTEEMDEGPNDEEMQEGRLWDEAQRTWNGYLKHKESWVRRAGLKREREEHERSGAAKRGRT
ncbi:hypothetical protein E8E12_002474 [Didymella heteroderae]|uniref:Uncharacterized protein n=1 Tax=Didymella heteroderae TaxID=1769908 RepID=A0A9P5C088_9PLEO|nr:hypothetical protein E8E12_002474 [Didymella heteroderae]